MVKYSCDICQRPCKRDNTIKTLVEKKVQDILSKINEEEIKIDSTTTNEETTNIDSTTTTIIQSNQMDYSTKTRMELIALCKEHKIKGYNGKKNEDIVKLLTYSSVKNEVIIPIQTTAQPTFIEVCAGCGGLSSGFIEAGFNPLLINEIDLGASKISLLHER